MPRVDQSEWIAFLAQQPNAHLLQTAPWGELKSEFGWRAEHVVVGESGVQILFRQLPFGYHLAYIPRGPLGKNWEGLWPQVDTICRQFRTVFLKVEPDLWAVEHSDYAALFPDTFLTSDHQIQPARTLLVDLNGDEDEVLARMKQKTRYNIRLAVKRGVKITKSSDVNIFAALVKETGARDKFGVHTEVYYQRAYDLFHPIGACELLVAEFEGQPLAAFMVFAQGKRAWYLYGASSNRQRNRMPTYLLQWEAIRWARDKGCDEYDLWGVPDADLETLETQFTTRSDGLWGVYRNKRGFGGELKRVAGAWDRVYIPTLYKLYQLYVGWRGA